MNMKTPLLSTLILSICSVAFSVRAELWVDQSAPAGGSGSAQAPFASINQAIKAAQPGDTITVRQGTYHEAVNLSVSGTAERPTVLRAAAGQRVILSGFAPISGWKPAGDGVYTATIDGAIGDLYVGMKSQPVSRWPDLDEPMRYVSAPDAKAGTFQDTAAFPDAPFLKALAAEPKSAKVFLYVALGNYYSTIPLAGLDIAAHTVKFGEARAAAGIKGKSDRSQDRYQLANHPALIRKPGQWAFEAMDNKQTRVYFRPVAEADLKTTQYRQSPGRVLMIGGRQDMVSYIRVEGLEICGSAKAGLEISRADHVTVSRCLIHNNDGTGIGSRRSNNVEVKNCISMLNGGGIGIASANNILVEGNEIALNMVDGIDVAGNVTGRPNGEPETSNVMLRRNYIHHHIFLSHPDNVQAYRGVKNWIIEDNVLLFGGQAVMTEEVDGAALRNTVAVGTGAVAVIFGHSNSHHWTIENCTVGLGGWGTFSLTGKEYNLRNNIIWNSPLPLVDTLTSDYNLFYAARDSQAVCLMSKPRWRSFTSIAEATEASHQEQHSKRALPSFRNAPVSQACTMADDSNRADRLVLRLAGGVEMADFQVDDRVEINGDGILRRITAADAKAIQFDPPLPRRPFRDALVWNWKKGTSTTLDLRPADGSPALTAGEGGKPAGATLDIPAFQRGDFNGDGKRDIPEIPEDLKQAMPSPNDIVIPLQGA